MTPFIITMPLHDRASLIFTGIEIVNLWVIYFLPCAIENHNKSIQKGQQHNIEFYISLGLIGLPVSL